ncbi:hypothetical protein MTR67_031554 [Solanum verrucosum]|uniref:DUF4283 domain-containing protein n=1 Tax=Solanum verrucosum TaxID=315347 RepID=A0AAF0U2V0_SOLVR|nr:hypothetical protein MTR67_031554 [Solanum verrucosum]
MIDINMKASEADHLHNTQSSSGVETDKLINGIRTIKLSKEDKERLYAPWRCSLIIKLMGRRIVHHYLKSKIQDISKPMENFPLIDLGSDYYIVKFSKEENMMTALQKGPWFINDHYLSVRWWEPSFVPNEASLTHSAVWIMLPHLPTEFYDGQLTKIGGTIGKLLKVDACTSATLIGRYARLCVEVADEVGQVANIDGRVDMQMEETSLSPNLSLSNHTTLLTNAIHYKSHSKDFQSSHANLHFTSSTISSIIGNHVETTNFHEQEKIPTTPLLVTQLSSSKYEQLFPYPPTGCSASCGGGNPTSSFAAPDPVLDRIRFKRPSNLLHNGHKWGEHNENHPKSQLIGSAYHGGYEVGNGQLCEPPLDGKCVPHSSSWGTKSLPQHANTVGPPTTLQPINELELTSPTSFLYSSGSHRQQPSILSMGSSPTIGACSSSALSSSNGKSSASYMASWEQPATTIMASWEQEGGGSAEKLLHQNLNPQACCPNAIPEEGGQEIYPHVLVALAKCSFDLRPAVNTALICSPQHYYPVRFPQGRSSDRESLIHLLSND